jgi:hypothetical protein
VIVVVIVKVPGDRYVWNAGTFIAVPLPPTEPAVTAVPSPQFTVAE